jgi:pimeloyl-ACP methyl ester carboxylesterase
MRNRFKVLTTGIVLVLAVAGCSTWTRTEMSSRRGYSFQTDLQSGVDWSCVFLDCSFELHYFDGPPDYNELRNKHVLYIPGGPGDIVERENPPLNSLNTRSKYVYFDVRGTGYSLIPGSNAYDRFLRAEKVVEDIEALRKKYFNECSSPTESMCEQGLKPWDAIYAPSWGTVVAQMYAKRYPTSVKALILSAPVARAISIGDTGAARRQMIVDNLLDVYRKHRQSPCSWPTQIDPFSPDLQWTENFCFLTNNELTDIGNRLMALLNDIERDYGSTDFVGRYYDKLIIMDTDFKTKYPYPVEFFRALIWLEWYGGGEDVGFRFSKEVRTKKIDAAFFLGYYLKLDAPTPLVNNNGEREEFVCERNRPFLDLVISNSILPPATAGIPDPEAFIRRKFCTRITSAEKALDREAMSDDSLRARSVFGVFDGVARWIFRLMNEMGRTDSENCFTVASLRDIASGDLLPDKETVRELVKRIGTSGLSSDERICPWDPARYAHEIPTLILTGASDPIIAGGQAEYIYYNGLTPGKRAFVKFLGAGHQWSPQVQVESGDSEEDLVNRGVANFASIIEFFLNNTTNVDDFLIDPEVSRNLGKLNARFWP